MTVSDALNHNNYCRFKIVPHQAHEQEIIRDTMAVLLGLFSKLHRT